MVRRTSCWGSLTGRRRRRTWSRRVKMAVLAPMPRARVRTATAVKPGVRASMRKVYFKSRRTVSSQPMKFIRRVASLPILVTGTPRAARGKDEESGEKFDEIESAGLVGRRPESLEALRPIPARSRPPPKGLEFEGRRQNIAKEGVLGKQNGKEKRK